jgi:hypothetical protein
LTSCSRDELVNGVTTPACASAVGQIDNAVGYYYAYSLVAVAVFFLKFS